MDNPIGWVEIPVQNLQRAIRFYNYVFGWELSITDLGPLQMAMLPADHEGKGASGALVQNENYSPSDNKGVLIYFSCKNVQNHIDRVFHAGGTVISGKKMITPDAGFMALALDSEGNRIAFHSTE